MGAMRSAQSGSGGAGCSEATRSKIDRASGEMLARDIGKFSGTGRFAASAAASAPEKETKARGKRGLGEERALARAKHVKSDGSFASRQRALTSVEGHRVGG